MAKVDRNQGELSSVAATQKRWRRRLPTALAIAIVALVGASVGAVAAATSNVSIQFNFHKPSTAEPVIPPPGGSPTICFTPTSVSVADAKQHLPFQIYRLTDPQATLTSSQYAQGCGGAKGLDLTYTVGAYFIEIVEAPATSTSGAPVINLKGNGSVSLAQAGWSVIQVGTQSYAVHSTAGGKGPAGIDMAVWQIGGTQFTLSAQPHGPQSIATPIPMELFQQIVSEVAPA